MDAREFHPEVGTTARAVLLNGTKPLGAHVTPFASLMTHMEPLDLPAGGVLFREGDAGDGRMYAMLSGEIRLVRGGSMLERLSGEGGIFGELALIDDLPRMATATAESPTRVAVITKDRFRELILRNPSFALEMMKILAGRARANA